NGQSVTAAGACAGIDEALTAVHMTPTECGASGSARHQGRLAGASSAPTRRPTPFVDIVESRRGNSRFDTGDRVLT
ncbi:MAG TPA: hypothetical protein VGG08_06220, partial [Solirubrobacteraceae bacterium]